MASATVPLTSTISYFGTWVSKQYPAHFAKGDASAVVNHCTGNVSLTMRYTGSYNTNFVKNLTATISRPEGSSLSTATTGGYIMNATCALNQQIIFIATTFTDQEISGTYTTTNPSDNGTFTMRAAMNATASLKSLENSFETTQSGSICTIM
jgi:hypothetical protein